MTKLLLVEDSRVLSKMIALRIEKKLNKEVIPCETLAEAKEAIEKHRDQIFLSVVNLVLPDAPDAEILDLTLGADIPTVVFTSTFSNELRSSLFRRRVLDYVVKDSPASIDYLIDLIHRVDQNRKIKAMVVDDSSSARKIISQMLSDYQFQVIEAKDGQEAYEILKKTPDVKLVVTDFNMPRMDGFELIKEIRKIKKRDEVAIIGLSATDNITLSARMIKAGANDFIIKPFQREEFFCRVSQNMDVIEHIEALVNAATRDYLTGLYNRRHFYDLVKGVMASRKRGGISVSVAMFDIDHFKNVNDTYGHDVGDEALIAVANALNSRCRETDILARMGGEEFCLVTVGSKIEEIKDIHDNFREAIANIPFVAGGEPLPIRMSIGVSVNPDLDIEGMLKEADDMLYEAKETGRNRVVVAPLP